MPRVRSDRPAAAKTDRQSVARAVGVFAVTGIAALALIGFLSVRILQHTGEREAIRDAKQEAGLAGHGIVAPVIGAGLLSMRGDAQRAVDAVVRRYVLRDPVVRVKIWDSSGRILYSDARPLIAAHYGLSSSELTALRTGGADAELSDLGKPENRFERGFGKALEVYVGVRAPGGRRLLYEEYLRYSSVAASGKRLWSSFAPALIVTLIALELAQIPLAFSLARRLRRRQEERELLLRRAIEASDVERRRIARDVHDGVVQNLAGISFSLAATARTRDRSAEELSALIEAAAAETRESVRALRALLVDIYPPTLQRAGLSGALADLAAGLQARDVEAEIELRAEEIPADCEPVLYRVAQEALRNVAMHSNARHVRVRAGRSNGSVFLSVEDDGRGFDPAHAATSADHFGLRMISDLAGEAGGRLTLDSSPGAGTKVRIELPRR